MVLQVCDHLLLVQQDVGKLVGRDLSFGLGELQLEVLVQFAENGEELGNGNEFIISDDCYFALLGLCETLSADEFLDVLVFLELDEGDELVRVFPAFDLVYSDFGCHWFIKIIIESCCW